MDPTQTLFHRHGAASLEKQIHFAEVIGTRPPRLELAAGCIRYGDDLRFRIQLLGHESQRSKTWRWAWALAQPGVPLDLMQGAAHLRSFGLRNQIGGLIAEEYPLAQADSDFSCMLAMGVTRGNAYFRVPHPTHDGAAFYLIKDASFPRPVLRMGRLAEVFQRLAARWAINHAKAWAGYMKHHRYPVRQEGSVMVATTPAGELRAVFDATGQLVKVEAGRVTPTA